MRYIIDTNVAIYLRDAHPEIIHKIECLKGDISLSILSVVELEGGIEKGAGKRRLLLDNLLETLETLPFGDVDAQVYGKIVAQCGYSRSRIFDRMIAAQALVLDATLITINGADFRDIPDLKLEIWPSPTV